MGISWTPPPGSGDTSSWLWHEVLLVPKDDRKPDEVRPIHGRVRKVLRRDRVGAVLEAPGGRHRDKATETARTGTIFAEAPVKQDEQQRHEH